MSPIALDIDEAAKAISLSRRTLDRLAKSGEIPSYWVGAKQLFRPADLEAWVLSLPTERKRDVS